MATVIVNVQLPEEVMAVVEMATRRAKSGRAIPEGGGRLRLEFDLPAATDALAPPAAKRQLTVSTQDAKTFVFESQWREVKDERAKRFLAGAPVSASASQWCGHCKKDVPLDGYVPSARGRKGQWCKACRNSNRRYCSRCHRVRVRRWWAPSRWAKPGAPCRDCETQGAQGA